jgi:glutaconate CoA-transferase subunit B
MYTTKELIVCCLSREIRDYEFSVVGSYSEIPMAAMLLAKKTHAPNLNFYSVLGLNMKGPIFHSSTDYRNFKGMEDRADMDKILSVLTKGVDFFFASAIQVDKCGNVNLSCIGDHKKPLFRGPGPAGLASLTNSSKRFYIYIPSHKKRTLVERVDFISGAGFLGGYDERRNLGLSGGPCKIITELCIFDFNENTKHARLKSIHPGVSIDYIRENTGFELIMSDNISTTGPPTDEELKILRNEIDPSGILR